MLHHREPEGGAAAAGVPHTLSSVADGDGVGSAQAPTQLGWLAFWMSGTLMSFIVAALSVRALANTLNAFEMMSIRSLGGLVILGLMALARPELRRSVRIHQMGWQGFRN